jgi:single-stranded DNA-binding protein
MTFPNSDGNVSFRIARIDHRRGRPARRRRENVVVRVKIWDKRGNFVVRIDIWNKRGNFVGRVGARIDD